MMRRVTDLVGATVLLLLTTPILIVGILLVWVDSGRPIFFGHRRLGRGGRPFRCWKLRTMEVNAEGRLARDEGLNARYRSNGFKLAAHEDPRLIRVGPWLRRTYIDELPQLFNVLAGTMSLIGPRPIVADELALFGDHGQVLLEVKPGLFGAWTSLGLERPDYPERAGLEIGYVRNRSLRQDLRILVRSVPVVLRGFDDAQ